KPSRDLRREWGLDENPTIGTIGRLEPIKGHDVLIRAMPTILRHIPKATLLIAGHDPWGYGGHLQALINSLSLKQRVRLIGFQEDIPSFLHALDIFAFASRSEGFGQVVIEAMAAGKPVVASRIAPLTEIVVDGETGILVPPDDPEAFAKTIVRLLSGPEERQQMGKLGVQRVYENFSTKVMGQKTIGIYDRVLASHSR
ncbi:MAG: glycosyltransferase family 4 protein, partial [Candidatus Fervidibacter sp.]